MRQHLITNQRKCSDRHTHRQTETDTRYAQCMYCMCGVWCIFHSSNCIAQFSFAILILQFYFAEMVCYFCDTFYLLSSFMFMIILLRGVVYLPRQIRLWHFIFSYFFCRFENCTFHLYHLFWLMQKHVPMFQIQSLRILRYHFHK